MMVGVGVVWRGRFSAPILYSRGGVAVMILRMGAAGGEGNECRIIVLRLLPLEDVGWMGIDTG
jgi:hypothetical protein